MTAQPIMPFAPMLCPATRARMGDRWYYLATMTFAQIARAVQPVPQLSEKKQLKEWIQRDLRRERTAQISSYLRTNEQRFFNALVLGVFGGEPVWSAIEVEDRLKISGHDLDERLSNAFGIVELSGEENIFAIDGQHRVEGIRDAVGQDPSVGEEEQAVIFIAHHTTDEGRARTRRLFATLNTYARPITDRETVAISEDNAFAIATRRLIEKYPGLDLDHVPLLPTTNIPENEKSSITSVVGLYGLTQELAPAAIRRAKKTHIIGPSTEETTNDIYVETAAFWDALKKCFPQIKKVCAANPADEAAARYRHKDGGHLLFRPVGIKAFAQAARVLVDRGEDFSGAVSRLAKVPMEVDDELWSGVFWKPENGTMLHKYGRLALNVLLKQVGAGPASKKYSVPDEYMRITGHPYPRK